MEITAGIGDVSTEGDVLDNLLHVVSKCLTIFCMLLQNVSLSKLFYSKDSFVVIVSLYNSINKLYN